MLQRVEGIQGTRARLFMSRHKIYTMAAEIERHPQFESIMRMHFILLQGPYRQRPFFYKNVLKYGRFMVLMTLLSRYFSQRYPLLSEVRNVCVARGFCSKNSLESFYLLLRATGLMTIGGHPDDRRLRTFRPCGLAFSELRKTLNSLIKPMLELYPRCPVLDHVDSLDDQAFLGVYFRGYKQLLDRDLILCELVPECRWLLHKDGGHMLMLALYFDALAPSHQGSGFKGTSYLRLARDASVSKTHLIRLVQEGETRGYFAVHDKSIIQVLPDFMSLVSRIISLCFVMALYAVKTGSDNWFHDSSPLPFNETVT